jgi:hypothetical protein
LTAEFPKFRVTRVAWWARAITIIFELTFMGNRAAMKHSVFKLCNKPVRVLPAAAAAIPQKPGKRRPCVSSLGWRVFQIMKQIMESPSHAPDSFLILKHQRAEAIF